MKYVLRNEYGAFRARKGYGAPYARNLISALVFESKEEAKQKRGIFETIVPLDNYR